MNEIKEARIPVVESFAFVMPVFDHGGDEKKRDFKWIPSQAVLNADMGVMVCAWDFKTQRWTSHLFEAHNAIERARTWCRKHHREVCKKMGINP